MTRQTQQLRIIGGKWRSRKVGFLALEGLRPTTDATRETLFNWLTNVIEGATCLDLFAGSGALGFEALSRGAKQVLFVDKSIKVVHKLQESVKILQASNVEFLCAAMPQQMQKIANKAFDIVFVDPPFHKNLVGICCEALEANQLIKPEGYIFVEIERGVSFESSLPANWEIIKKKNRGQVDYYLLQRHVVAEAI